MSEITLLQRIERAVEASLDETVDDKKLGQARFGRLILVAGNGMTRIAAGLQSQVKDLKWAEWAKSALSEVDKTRSLSYLESLGYNYPEIFEYATKLAQDNKKALKSTWQYLWNFVVALESSQFHVALLHAADHVITTNYDDLLEYSARTHGLSIAVSALFARSEVFNKLLGTPINTRTIFKIHGSLPLRSDVGEENQKKFDDWFVGRPLYGATPLHLGPDETITNRDLYEKYAIALSQKKFVHIFRDVYDLLTKGDQRNNQKTLVVLCGLGLRAEELLLTRLLTCCLQCGTEEGRRPPELAVVVIEPALDPLYKYSRFGIRPIRIPLGLVSSPATRAVANLSALLSLLKRVDAPRVKNDVHVIQDILHRAEFKKSCNRVSRVIAVGQSAINRVHGIETAVAQEQAYAPRDELTWAPREISMSGSEDEQERKYWLNSVEVGGQVLIPALVFDALDISCSIASQIYTDEIGSKVLSRLQETSALDYEWITLNQRIASIPQLSGTSPQTDNATVATWMGLRTIIDSRPRVPTKLEFKIRNDRTETDFFGLGAKVLYTSKDLWNNLAPEIAALETNRKPLIVYDSGGAGDFSAEEWVAQNEGVVIASVLATLAWFEIENESDRFQAKKAWRHRFDERQPKDDRGRIFQIQKFLETLEQTKGELPWFLRNRDILGRSQAFITTLGELGMIYWLKDVEGGPFWSGIEKPVDDADVRCGLACGDVARAGFTAALLPMAERGGLSPEAFHYAVAWANWFGAQKLKYFSIEDFFKLLKRHKIGEVLAQPPTMFSSVGDSSSLGCAVEDCRCHLVFGSSRALDSRGKLCGVLAGWLADSKKFFTAGETETSTRRKWVERVNEWRTKRYSEKP